MPGRGRRVGSLVGLVGLAGAPLAVLALTATPAGAAGGPGCPAGNDANNIEVTTNTDLAVRAAFTTANGRDGPQTICIDSGVGTILLTGGALGYFNTPHLTPGLTLEGNGATLHSNGADRVIVNSTLGPLTLDKVTVTGGITNSGGGGVDSVGSLVIVTNSTISNNTTTSGGGGGITGFGAVTVTNSTISGNTATGGGGIIAGGAVTVTNSTISNNTATGSGAEGGGISEPSGNVTVTNSTISGNTASGSGGAEGGGIRESSGNVTVTNSTISGNTASGTGSPEGGGIRESSGNVTLVYATVVQNTSPDGAQIRSSSGSLTSFGSVVALPQGGSTNCTGVTTTSNGFNFSDDTSCGFTAGTDKQNAGDPGLGALANNGGPTQTRLPQTGSPLIDAIALASCQADGASGITTDQRGFTRPAGPGCDIGAVEVQLAAAAAPVLVTPRFTG